MTVVYRLANIFFAVITKPFASRRQFLPLGLGVASQSRACVYISTGAYHDLKIGGLLARVSGVSEFVVTDMPRYGSDRRPGGGRQRGSRCQPYNPTELLRYLLTFSLIAVGKTTITDPMRVSLTVSQPLT